MKLIIFYIIRRKMKRKINSRKIVSIIYIIIHYNSLFLNTDNSLLLANNDTYSICEINNYINDANIYFIKFNLIKSYLISVS